MLEYEMSRVGLGTTISILSMLLHSDQQIVLHVPPDYCTVRDLKKIFNIENLTIIDKKILKNDLWPQCTDKSKFFSPYFSVDNLTLFGQPRPVAVGRKPCIGLATWDLQHESDTNVFPYNRLYTKEFWASVFHLVQATGYDVVTFNMLDVDLEHKCWMLNELCDCVIGYEGGICHLAHLLAIPCIIMPWHHHEDGSEPHPDGSLWYVPHKLHLDRRSYFVKSQQEVLLWSPESLKKLIAQLHLGCNNNIFFNENLIIDKEKLTIVSHNGQDLNPNLSKFEIAFIKQHIKNIAVGGVVQQ